MAEKQLIHWIKNERSGEVLYLIAVTCIERLVELGKAGTLKAILDSGTTCLYKMSKK